MSEEPARGPGRDEDPARHACDRPGAAPVPAAPDWLDDDEWAARAAVIVVEEEPADPDLEEDEEDGPDWEGMAAIIAAAREITAADARDAAHAARVVFDGGFGAVGAAPGPRGPGNPGSSAPFPGEHASPAAGFGSGFALDTAPGCLALAEFADTVAGPDDRYPGATDDEIMGVICALDRVVAHVTARQLAAVAEFIRRRPAEDSAQDLAQSEGQDTVTGTSQKAQAGPRSSSEDPGKAALEDQRKADGSGGAGAHAGGMPGWDEFAVKELAWALAESQATAEDMMAVAWQLEAKLPGTKAALREGRIRMSKAAAIARATWLLDAKEAAAAEDMVLGRASVLTPPGVRDAIGRAVMEVAPRKARKRREEAAKLARVERWVEDSGNAGLAGRQLPSAQVLAADQRITAWARQLRAAGLAGDMDVLRARAFLDILLGMDSRLAAAATAATAATAAATAGPGDPADGGPGPSGPDGGPGLFGPPVPPGGSVLPPGFCGSINLTVPLVTALGLADRPGQAGTLGPVDPWLARDLVRSAAGNPKTTWCLTVTDEHGHAVGHGCARPEPRRRPPRRARGGGPGPPGGHDPPSPGGEDDLHGRHGLPGDPRDTGGARFSFTAADQHGPQGGYGAWRLSTGTPGQPDLIIAVHPIASAECDHRFQAAGHDPGVLLRHLSQIRHARCTAPGCRRPAASCDFEHNVRYEAGGRTCLCNGGPKCRGDHRLKQDPRWKVDQHPDGTFTWTTPAGRQYTTEPTRYPI